MNDPQRMVLLAIIASITALLILFIYFKFFAKKNSNYFFILLIISLPPIVSIFRPGSYESGDLSLHTMRTISFYHILFVEHLLPRWTPEFNVGYGDPHFLFSYFLPYFIGSLLHFFGFSFLNSIKILLAFSFISSGVAMYLWAKDELGKKAGFVSALFYLFVPYHLVDIHFRVTIAETLSFVFLPLLLFFTKRIINKAKLLSVISFAISYGLLILTHQIISLFFSSILCFYALFLWFNKKEKHIKDLLAFFLSIILGLLCSAFYWLPIVAEARYTQASLSETISSFTPLLELLYSPWRWGFLFQGHKGELGLIIGYTQLFIVASSIYLLITNQLSKRLKQLLLFFLILFFLLIFMITPYSQTIWKITPLLKYTQYSYRLLEFVALCTSIIAGIVVTRWNKNVFIILLCLLTVFSTILNWGNRRAIPQVVDSYLIKEFKNKPDVGMYLEPSSPVWADLEKSHVRIKPKNPIEVIRGVAEIKQIFRTSIQHEYIIHAKSAVTLKENTLYFPGWAVFVDNNLHQFSYKDNKYPGIIVFSLHEGVYKVTVRFADTPVRSLSKTISFTTILLLFIVIFFPISVRYIRDKKIKLSA